MELLTFRTDAGGTSRFGALLSGERVLDVTTRGGLPAALRECIQGGDAALAARSTKPKPG